MDPLTDAFGFPYRLSFEERLGQCTGAVSCGIRHLPLGVGGRHAWVPCVCACARPSWPGRAGRPPGRNLVRLTFPLVVFVFLLCSAPCGLGMPLSCSLVCLLSSLCWFLSPFFCSSFPLRAPVVSCFLWLPARGALGLGAVCSFTPPLLSFFSFPLCAPVVSCFLRFLRPGCPGPWRCVVPAPAAPSRFFFFFFSSFFLCFAAFLLLPFFSAFPLPPPSFFPSFCAPPPPLVCFVGLPLLGSPCALAAFVFPA